MKNKHCIELLLWKCNQKSNKPLKVNIFFPLWICFYRWGQVGSRCLKRVLFNIESKPAAWISNITAAHFRSKLQRAEINVDGCVASRCVQLRVAAERTLAAAATACERSIKSNTDWHQSLRSSESWWIIEGQLPARFVCLLDLYFSSRTQEQRSCMINWPNSRK